MAMIARLYNYLLDVRDRQRIAIGLSKGMAAMQARHVDLRRPETWEFSGFSQNGEDGILGVLRDQLGHRNRYFIEIGAADGIDNNSAWLILTAKYNGIMIDGNPDLIARARRIVANYSIGVECRQLFVSMDSAAALRAASIHHDPDVFSLDIDGNDYYIAKAILDVGFRPKIFVVEYNSVYGPERSVTIPYQKDFVFTDSHASQLYYGASILGWRNFFAARGYRFVTVDRNGVNGFFVDPAHFSVEFLDGIMPLTFAENQYQLGKFHCPSESQFKFIADRPFVLI